MFAWLLPLLGPFGDFLIKWWNSRKPPGEVTEGEKVGAATDQAATSAAAVKTEAAIAQAAVDAPKTTAATIDDLNTGRF